MAIDYVRLTARVKALIEANGRSCTFARKGRAPKDSDKPWRGPVTEASDPVEATDPLSYANVKALFTSAEELADPADITLRKQDVLLVSEESFPAGHIPVDELDTVSDGSDTFSIESAKPLAPGDTTIIWILYLKD